MKRADRLAEVVAEAGLDQLIVADLVNPGDSGREAQADVFWLTGFTGTSALCLIAPEERLFLTDFRYTQRAEREVDPSFDRVEAEELRRIAAAAELADRVYEWICERGLAGRTEREVQLAAEQHMRELGATAAAFPTIVAAGENAALPHHEASEREIGPGELVIIDMGAIVDGYCSDCTRTFATGEVGAEATDAYELVLSAQQAALDAVGPGVSGKDADSVSREPIDAAGHAEHYGHGLGHGVGIEVHEAPRLSQRSEDTLAAGDVVTVEPGVYVPGSFGVRIEDLVTITDDGFRNLSSVPKDLRVVG